MIWDKETMQKSKLNGASFLQRRLRADFGESANCHKVLQLIGNLAEPSIDLVPKKGSNWLLTHLQNLNFLQNIKTKVRENKITARGFIRNR